MTTINDALRARANAVMTHHQRWTSRATVAAVAGVSETRLMGILNGFYTPELDEWERIFAALEVDLFGTEIFPPSVPTPADPVVTPASMGLCGAKHRHLEIFCARGIGHTAEHLGNGRSWPQGQEMTQTQLVRAMRDDLTAVQSRMAALERRMSSVAKHKHTVSGAVTTTTSAPTPK